MNLLANETSPYLRQHKDNPVNWHPWGDEAFAEAEARDVPVLLSIGYSACHWCHVMAHESFENDTIAQQMNRTFVNIKVDREERPDIDDIYMDAVQAMTGSGGWPLTVVLTPEAEPFFGATYIPPANFSALMTQIDEAWKTNRSAIVDHASEVTDALRSATDRKPDKRLPDIEVLDRGAVTLQQQHDPVFGGFGGAPKFPQAMNIDALLRHYRRTGDTDSLDMAVHSLKAMITGGIYDHVGGGFARYSVDDRWDIPHFEKMLYDQALIAAALLHAWKLTGDPDIAMALHETITYVLRDLTNDEGGFCSAEDADAEGTEGSFTVFTPSQIEAILGGDAQEFCDWFTITDQGNFEGSSNPRRPPNSTILRSTKMETLRARVFDAREKRVRPGLDDKVLLEWNALMLSTLAEAAATFQNPTWMNAAKRNALFLLNYLRDNTGRWRRAWAQGHSQHTPVAGDLAALTDAFTRLYEASGEEIWLAEAISAAESLISGYADLIDGGFFTTANDAERLITRGKDLMDNATPGANSLAAVALIRLSSLADRSDFREEAIAAIRLVAEAIDQHPTAFGHMLQAVALAHDPPIELVITGSRDDLVEVAQGGFHPDVVLSWGERIPGSALWEHKEDGLAYACRDYVCKAPVSSANELADLLG